MRVTAIRGDTALERVKACADRFREFMPPDFHIVALESGMPVESAHEENSTGPNNTPASATFAARFSRQWGNMPDAASVHGGSVAMALDLLAGPALFAHSRHWQHSGVTRVLSITYMRPVMYEQDLLIECEVLQLTKRAATVKGSIRRKSDGALLAVAMSERVNGGTNLKL